MQQPSYAHGMPKALNITVVDPKAGGEPVAEAKEGSFVTHSGGIDVYLKNPRIQDGYDFDTTKLYEVTLKDLKGETRGWKRLYWVSPPGFEKDLEVLVFSSNKPEA